ncbi:copia protein, partial [Tanacetum coccineum]
MSSEIKPTRDKDGESIDDTKYRGMIGSLLYLTASQPDIIFSVCLCARFQEDPKTSHLEAVKRIFRYIKGTTHLGLWYPKGTGVETIIYADSDHPGDYVDRTSTSDMCTLMGCCLTSWFSKKQTALSISTTKAEYVSARKSCQQALWMKQALVDYAIKLDDIPVICDNKGAIDLSKNPVLHSRTKHIEIRHHFFRDNVQKGNISIEKVSFEDKIVDILTKPLKREPFNLLRLGQKDAIHMANTLVMSREIVLNGDVYFGDVKGRIPHGRGLILASGIGIHTVYCGIPQLSMHTYMSKFNDEITPKLKHTGAGNLSMDNAGPHTNRSRKQDEKKLAQNAFDCARSIDPSLALPWASMSADMSMLLVLSIPLSIDDGHYHFQMRQDGRVGSIHYEAGEPLFTNLEYLYQLGEISKLTHAASQVTQKSLRCEKLTSFHLPPTHNYPRHGLLNVDKSTFGEIENFMDFQDSSHLKYSEGSGLKVPMCSRDKQITLSQITKLPHAASQVAQKALRCEKYPRHGLVNVDNSTFGEIEHFMDSKDSSHPKYFEVSGLKVPMWSRNGHTTLSQVSFKFKGSRFLCVQGMDRQLFLRDETLKADLTKKIKSE